jgi:hypothetical protein
LFTYTTNLHWDVGDGIGLEPEPVLVLNSRNNVLILGLFLGRQQVGFPAVLFYIRWGYLRLLPLAVDKRKICS